MSTPRGIVSFYFSLEKAVILPCYSFSGVKWKESLSYLHQDIFLDWECIREVATTCTTVCPCLCPKQSANCCQVCSHWWRPPYSIYIPSHSAFSLHCNCKLLWCRQTHAVGMGSTSTFDPALFSWNSLLRHKRGPFSADVTHTGKEAAVPYREHCTDSETVIEMQSKIWASDRSWNLWKCRGLKGWKGQTSVVPSDREIQCRWWTYLKGLYCHRENILHQALLFPIWEKARNCHYLSSIIWQLIRRGRTVPASYLPP